MNARKNLPSFFDFKFGFYDRDGLPGARPKVYG